MTCKDCNDTCDQCPKAKRYRVQPGGPYHIPGKDRALCGVRIDRPLHIGRRTFRKSMICKTCLAVESKAK